MKVTAVLLLTATGLLGAGLLGNGAAKEQENKAKEARPQEKPGRHPKQAVDRDGDPLPPHAVARLGTLRFRLAQGVWQAAAVPGGKQLLGLCSSTVVLWDAATGREVHRFEAPERKGDDLSFQRLAVSPDGETLAVGGLRTRNNTVLDSPLLLFDLATGRKLAEWSGHESHGHSEYPLVAFVTPTILASAGDDGSVCLWDVTGPRELRRLALTLPARGIFTAVVPSPDRKRIFVAGWDGKVSFWTEWEVATGKLVHREEGLPGWQVKLAPSPDGTSLALAMGMDRTPKEPGYTEMRLYSGPGWKECRRWQSHDGDDVGRCSVVFSPDGKTIATGGADGKVRRSDAVTGKEIGPVIDPCQQHCQNVAYLDAATLFTFGSQCTVQLWDAATGKAKRAFVGSESQINALAYSPDGRHVAVGGWGSSTRVWDAVEGTQIAQLGDGRFGTAGLQFSPDGKWLISGALDGRVRLWDWARGGAPTRSFDHKVALHSIALSPDGKSVATGGDDGAVYVSALATGERIHRLESAGRAEPGSLAFSPDGKALFSASLQGIHHWNLATGKEVRLIKPESLGHSTDHASNLAFSPRGRWGYSSGYDGSICVWEVGRGLLARVIKEKEPGYNGGIHCDGGWSSIALSPDGTRLAASWRYNWKNPAVHLWDLTTGQKVALTGHHAPVAQLAFSRDGRRLISGSYDTTALVWDITRLGPGGKVPDGKALAGLWKDLGANDPKVAYAAVCQGAAAGDAAVGRLKPDLRPSVAVDAERVAALVRRLDSDTFAQREKASRELADLGPAAEMPLREALAKARSPEIRRRLERVLEGQEAEHRRLGNAVEVLEMIGTPAARRLLLDLAKGAGGSRLTREARAAVDRIEKRP